MGALVGPASEYDREELAIVADALAEENALLADQVSYFRGKLVRRAIDEAAVAKTRLALHVSGSSMAYSFVALAAEGDFFSHTGAAVFLAAANLFVWTLVSTLRRFG